MTFRAFSTLSLPVGGRHRAAVSAVRATVPWVITLVALLLAAVATPAQAEAPPALPLLADDADTLAPVAADDAAPQPGVEAPMAEGTLGIGPSGNPDQSNWDVQLGFEEGVRGMAHPWQIGFQDPATPVMEEVLWVNDVVHIFIIAITIFVSILLAIVIFRFNAKANPTPRRFSHNAPLEIAWTVVPAIIVVIIMGVSVPLITVQRNLPDEPVAFTLKAIGRTWLWAYEYIPEEDPLLTQPIAEYSSTMLTEEVAARLGKPRLLGTDNPLVLPAERVVRIRSTADPEGVLHSFAVPAFGIKRDAVPGRPNDSWVKVRRPGIYYGQCSELCGEGHAFMPIEVVVLEEPMFARWAACMQTGERPSIPALEAEGVGASALCLVSITQPQRS